MIHLTALSETGIAIAHGDVTEFPCVIGRSEGNGFRIEHPGVSGKHAVIEKTAAGFRVRDLGSTNGTYFNSVRKEEEFEIKGLGMFYVGRIEIRFEIQEVTAERTRVMDPPTRLPGLAVDPGAVSARPPARPPSAIPNPHHVPELGPRPRLTGRQVLVRAPVTESGRSQFRRFALGSLFGALVIAARELATGTDLFELAISVAVFPFVVVIISTPFIFLSRLRAGRWQPLMIWSWAAVCSGPMAAVDLIAPIASFHSATARAAWYAEIGLDAAFYLLLIYVLYRASSPKSTLGSGLAVSGAIVSAISGLIIANNLVLGHGNVGWNGRIAYPLQTYTREKNPVSSLATDLDRSFEAVERSRKPASASAQESAE